MNRYLVYAPVPPAADAVPGDEFVVLKFPDGKILDENQIDGLIARKEAAREGGKPVEAGTVNYCVVMGRTRDDAIDAAIAKFNLGYEPADVVKRKRAEGMRATLASFGGDQVGDRLMDDMAKIFGGPFPR